MDVAHLSLDRLRRCTPFRTALRRLRAVFGWLGLGLVSVPFAVAAAQPLTLVDQGASRYRIVLPRQAIESERWAAEELQRYVERSSGVRLAVVDDTTKPGRYEILLGDNVHLRRLGLRPAQEILGTDGFFIRAEQECLVIAGGRPRGTLHGVHVFLEEQLGVRWFTPELEQVPSARRIEVPRSVRVEVPALEYREVFWTEMMRDGDFASRHRLNGDHCRLEARHGGPAVSYFPFVHSFDALIPPDLFQEHPEYFPMIHGERRGGYVQRCLAHPEVLRLSLERIRGWIRDHPAATIISVSQNDTINYCQCPECRAVDEAEGGPCGSLLRFVNAIAEVLEREHPSILVDTLAYQYTRNPPKTIRPRKNVIIRLCSIECCFAHPLESCPSAENRRFRDDILAWQPVASRLYVWDYTPNFAHYQQIFPNFDVLQPNVRFFVAHGVKGLFEQGNYSPGGLGEMGPLRAYLLAKLLWDPDADVARHLREFTEAYYGGAAPKIREYLEITHRLVRQEARHAHIFDSPQAAYLDPGMLEAAARVLAEAERAAGDESTRFRVQVARLPVWYGQLARRLVEGEARTELLRRFLDVARRAGITHISESKELAKWAAEMGAP